MDCPLLGHNPHKARKAKLQQPCSKTARSRSLRKWPHRRLLWGRRTQLVFARLHWGCHHSKTKPRKSNCYWSCKDTAQQWPRMKTWKASDIVGWLYISAWLWIRVTGKSGRQLAPYCIESCPSWAPSCWFQLSSIVPCCVSWNRQRSSKWVKAL